MSLNSTFIENLSSSERARARARANPAKNDAQKGCAMQLNGITLNEKKKTIKILVSKLKPLKNNLPDFKKMH